jgi:cation diffusion facilitator CzcD-associated flavoprotein CzcO
MPEVRHEVVILGAGMSGLCMAIQLKRAGIDDFVIIEKQDGLGGTWWDNTYPGAHVDVPAPVYSFSFAPNPRWTRRFASAPEIQAYMQQARTSSACSRTCAWEPARAKPLRRSAGRWEFAPNGGDTLQRALLRLQHRAAEPAALARHPGPRQLPPASSLHSARWDPRYDCTGSAWP